MSEADPPARWSISSREGADLGALLAADPTPVYNIAAVAYRTGLQPATLRVWEHRYGFPAPQRVGRRRLYSERDIQAIQWVSQRQSEGMTASAAIALLRERLAGAARLATGAAPPGALVAALEQAALRFEEGMVQQLLAEAFARYSVEQVCLEVIQPVLARIGEGWQAGRVDVAQEHFAAVLFRRQLDGLLRLAPPLPVERTVLAATPPGEWHEIGLLMACLFLARRGWRVVYLGPSVPPADLARAVAAVRPRALILSATLHEPARALADLVSRVRMEYTRPLLIGVGGQAVDADPLLRATVPAVYLGPTAVAGVARLVTLVDQGGGQADQAEGQRGGEESDPNPPPLRTEG
jgi:methanogenic corrinoid protein MtbC1